MIVNKQDRLWMTRLDDGTLIYDPEAFVEELKTIEIKYEGILGLQSGMRIALREVIYIVIEGFIKAWELQSRNPIKKSLASNNYGDELAAKSHESDAGAVVAKDVAPAIPTNTSEIPALEDIAKSIHYPECWDTMAYPNVWTAIWEMARCAICSECKPDEVERGANQKPVPEDWMPAKKEKWHEAFYDFYTLVADEMDKRSAMWGFECGLLQGEINATKRESSAEQVWDKIEDIMAEFGDQPNECLAIIGEQIGLSRHAKRNEIEGGK